MQRDRVRGHLKTLLLASVARDEPTHGYAAIASLETASNGYFAFNEGAVYPALHQLEADDLIRSQWDESSGRRRRVYSLTERGRKQLLDDVDDWRRFREGVDAIMKGVSWLNR